MLKASFLSVLLGAISMAGRSSPDAPVPEERFLFNADEVGTVEFPVSLEVTLAVRRVAWRHVSRAWPP